MKKSIAEEHIYYIKDVHKLERKPRSLVTSMFEKVLVDLSGEPTLVQNRKGAGFIGFHDTGRWTVDDDHVNQRRSKLS